MADADWAEAEQWMRAQLPEGRLWVAFSGGLDSTVLLHWLAHSPLRSRLHAIHVHHGLSANADDWLAICQRQAAAWQVPFVGARVVVQAGGDGLEGAARQARYAAFKQQLKAADGLLLGHHCDDQLETFAQRWLRGTGVRGLGAMHRSHQQHGFKLLRPLLRLSHQQLHDYAQQHQLTWIEDESNIDTQYSRNWWRHHGLPPIWQRFAKAKPAALRTIERLQQDADALEQLLQQQLLPLLSVSPWPGTVNERLDLTQLWQQPPALHSYLLRQWWQQQGLALPSQARLEAWLAMLQASADKQPSGTLGDYTWARYQNYLYLLPPPATDLAPLTALPNRWGEGELCLQGDMPAGACVVPAQALQANHFKPQGRPSKRLKLWWQSWGIPPWLRAQWPVLVDAQQQPLAFARASEQTCRSMETDHSLRLYWRRLGCDKSG
ncbi:tRNA(Ile)-lysidine synthase [Bacterioplanes sanyensis]|nr:tRNA(Ile)-lysidine synthase [Bacterioplanes sanyensis]